MQDLSFAASMLTLSSFGFLFSRYNVKHSGGFCCNAMFFLEVAYVAVIIYSVLVLFGVLSIADSREVLLIFMAMTVAILGIYTADRWLDRLEKVKDDLEKDEALSIKNTYLITNNKK